MGKVLLFNNVCKFSIYIVYHSDSLVTRNGKVHYSAYRPPKGIINQKILKLQKNKLLNTGPEKYLTVKVSHIVNVESVIKQ